MSKAIDVANATRVATVTVDVRKIPALCRTLKIPQSELAKRAGTRPDEVSRFFSAVAPGGLMDRLVDAVADMAAEAGIREVG